MSDPGPSEAEIRELLVANMFDGDDSGLVTMEAARFATTAAEIVVEHLADIAEIVNRRGVETDLDVARLAAALGGELHVDEEHGFPPGFSAHDLTVYVALEYHRLSVE
jgi:hypothetical protein